MITTLDQFDGFSILCPIASSIDNSDLKKVQTRVRYLYLDDDEDEYEEEPKISAYNGCSVYLNENKRPELRVDLVDVDDSPFSLVVTYVQEEHNLESRIEAPTPS